MKVEYSKGTFEDKRFLVPKRIVSFSLLLDHKAEIEITNSIIASLKIKDETFKIETKHYFNSSKSELVGKNESITIKNESLKSGSEKLSLECNHVDDLLLLIVLYINEAYLFDNLD